MRTSKKRKASQNDIDRIYIDQAFRDPGSSMAAHHCHNYYELYYVEKGGCHFMINDGIYDLAERDFILLPPHCFHCTRYLSERCKRCNIYFRAEDISKRVLECLPEPRHFFSQVRIFQVREDSASLINSLLSRMTAEGKQSDPQSSSLLYYYLNELFLLISRVCSFSAALPEIIHNADIQTLRAARFITANYMNPISSADIAAAAGFSPNHLSKRFREAAGIGVHEYLVATRLQHAVLELISTDDTITQIALRCGFSDSNYFKDVFKRKYGVTPREYRKNHADAHHTLH